MILGIGTDIIEIKRIIAGMEKTKGFIDKLFTEKEKAYFQTVQYRGETIAANFAAKEAVSKAIGTGFRKIVPLDIEVLHDTLGKPYVVLNEKLSASYPDRKLTSIHLSLSHCKEYAIAYVIIEGCEVNEISHC